MGIFRKLFTTSEGGEQGAEPEDKIQASSAPPSGPWTGVDLDGTLAVWDAASSLDRIGPPVPEMLTYVKRMVENGIRVKIFTARAADPDQISKIQKWLKKYLAD